MKRFSLFGVFVAVTLFVGGCATEKVYSKFKVTNSTYDMAVEKRLRTVKLYKKFDTIMIADVIYNDEWLRTAWVSDQAKVKRLADDDKKTLLRLQKRESDKEITFILCVYTAEDEWNDFSHRNSRWSILLESASGIIRPVLIKPVRQKELQMRDALPFNTNFRKFYVVTFLRDKAAVWPYHLVMSSPLGSARFTWSAP